MIRGMACSFADDTSLSFPSTNLAVIQKIVNNDFFHFERMGNQVVNNFSSMKKKKIKTEVMLISNIFNDYNLEIKFDINALKFVDAHEH